MPSGATSSIEHRGANESIYRKHSEELNRVGVALANALKLTHKLSGTAFELLDASQPIEASCLESLVSTQEKAQHLESAVSHVIRYYKPKDISMTGLTSRYCTELAEQGDLALQQLLKTAKVVRAILPKAGKSEE